MAVASSEWNHQLNSVDKVRAAKMELLPLPESTTRKRFLADTVLLETQWAWSLVVLGLLVT